MAIPISQLGIMASSWAWPRSISLCQPLLNLSSCHSQSRLGTKCTLLYRPSSHEFYYQYHQEETNKKPTSSAWTQISCFNRDWTFSLRDQWQTQQLKKKPLPRTERSAGQTSTPESRARHNCCTVGKNQCVSFKVCFTWTSKGNAIYLGRKGWGTLETS